MEDVHFWTILVAMFGIFVTLFLAMLKFNRNSVTKNDLNNSTESLRSETNKRLEEINRRIDEVNKRLDDATADRERIEAEAIAAREKIRNELKRYRVMNGKRLTQK